MRAFRFHFKRVSRSARHLVLLVGVSGANGGCEDIIGLKTTALTRDSGAAPGVNAGGTSSGSGGAGPVSSGGDFNAAGNSSSFGGTGAEQINPGEGGGPANSGGTYAFGSGGTTPEVAAGAGGAAGDAGEGPGGEGGNGASTSTGGMSGATNAGAGGEAGDGGNGGEANAPGIPVGAIVDVSGECLRAVTDTDTPGASVLDLQGCTNDPAEQWRMDADARLGLHQSSACLGAASDGSLEVGLESPITPAPQQQQWGFEGVYLVHDSGFCVDVPNGDFSDHTLVELWQCDFSVAQSWTVNALGQIRHGDFCLDVPSGNALPGQQLQVFTCSDDLPDNQRFALSAGTIQPRTSGVCIGVTQTPQNGVPLEIQKCSLTGRDPAQSFRLHGAIQNQGQCLTISNFGAPAGSRFDLESCAGSVNQIWDWYF